MAICVWETYLSLLLVHVFLKERSSKDDTGTVWGQLCCKTSVSKTSNWRVYLCLTTASFLLSAHVLIEV